MEPRDSTHRLFFAVWPNEAVRERIARTAEPLMRGKAARPIPAENLHITLAFLGPVVASKIPSVMAAAARTSGPSFTLSIERMEVWSDARILCLAPAHSVSLNALVDLLRFNLLAQQLEPDRKDFRPHVTLAREWRERTAADSTGPFEWPVDEFVLVESEAHGMGSRYQIVGRWPLSSPAVSR